MAYSLLYFALKTAFDVLSVLIICGEPSAPEKEYVKVERCFCSALKSFACHHFLVNSVWCVNEMGVGQNQPRRHTRWTRDWELRSQYTEDEAVINTHGWIKLFEG